MITPEEQAALREWGLENTDMNSDLFVAELNKILTEIKGRPEFMGLAYEIEATLDAIGDTGDVD